MPNSVGFAAGIDVRESSALEFGKILGWGFLELLDAGFAAEIDLAPFVLDRDFRIDRIAHHRAGLLRDLRAGRCVPLLVIGRVSAMAMAMSIMFLDVHFLLCVGCVSLLRAGGRFLGASGKQQERTRCERNSEKGDSESVHRRSPDIVVHCLSVLACLDAWEWIFLLGVPRFLQEFIALLSGTPGFDPPLPVRPGAATPRVKSPGACNVLAEKQETALVLHRATFGPNPRSKNRHSKD